MNKKAYAMIEYGVFLAAVIAALLGMAIYLKNSYNGRLRDSVKQLSGEVMYEPGGANSFTSAVVSSYEITNATNGTTESYSIQHRQTPIRDGSLNGL